MSEETTIMEIDLSKIDDSAIESFDRSFDIPSPEGGTASCHALAKVQIVRCGARYDLRTDISADLRLQCHRCLGLFAMHIEAELHLALQKGVASTIPEGLDEEDFLLLALDEERFDIFPRVREALILELPIKVLCTEDCKGVCPTCGANLNEGECGCRREEGDPRWEVLKRLVDEDNNS